MPPKDPTVSTGKLGYQQEFAGNLIKVDLEGGVCKQYERDLTLAAWENDNVFIAAIPCIHVEVCSGHQNNWPFSDGLKCHMCLTCK